ncbi:glutamine--fructose-6-phosphate transaminase (isomerizing) [Bdellovibrio sp. NC01]|uniref:glutamine--fructose-6-phosphate transaminase (isomerizing) n=1 Tax=Bdellovibrio sp. NC01 TaxID=2220073 RepID=UPI00115A2F0A|nr:glutamine--fructose-6-phosphate transaminase (isomerizing) [Bdellovibrio sp. NC01]QDK39135.1 glutamine--fructose-6-phosphate transaminase (isomerizing) [Bdellovibrio sp. NC01]
MCGIVGYLGPQNPKDIIISGLKKLEYRGYDSAGIAVLDHGKTKRVRAQGKLKALEDKLVGEKFDGHLGIGHTRWATHGKPSERNAHPHQVRGINLVHNGIIENYLDIREELLAQGADITSDTDTELVAHLIANEVENTKDLFKAVERTLTKLRGAFSILVMWEQEPDRLIAFKDGPPLVVGLGEKEMFVASDVQALIQYTKKFVYLDDREIAEIKGADVKFFSANGFPIQKKVVELNWNPEMVEKQGYAHYMLKEIYEQPRAVASAIEPHVNPETFAVALKKVGFGGQPVQKLEELDIATDWAKTQEVFKGIERVFIIACGTSYYAGTVGKYLIEQLARIPVEVDIASEFRYRNPVIPAKTLVMTISQSGETADTLAAIRLAKEMGATTLSICNVRNSTIDREAHGHLYMNSGPEIGVASTKAFTSTLAVLNCLAIAMAHTRGNLNDKEQAELVKSLLAVPSQMESVLAFDKYFNEAANDLKQFRGFLYMGRGTSFPIAMEGALKLKELAYMHAEGYAAGEMKHGPLALIDERMAIVMVAPTDHWYEKTISNLEEARARGGKIISIGTGENDKLRGISEHYLALPKAHWTVNTILSVIPLQLMSYHLACNLGYDVDQPRNLAKSVTVE